MRISSCKSFASPSREFEDLSRNITHIIVVTSWESGRGSSRNFSSFSRLLTDDFSDRELIAQLIELPVKFAGREEKQPLPETNDRVIDQRVGVLGIWERNEAAS